MRSRSVTILLVSAAVGLGTAWVGSTGLRLRDVTVGPDLHAAEQDSASHSALTLPVAVDGAVTPERISDALAFKHFIMATIPTDVVESAKDVQRREAILTNVGISLADRAAFVVAVKDARAALMAIQVAKQQLGATPDAAAAQESVKQLRAQENIIFDDARVALRNALSTEGSELLERYVRERVKRRITIYGVAPQD